MVQHCSWRASQRSPKAPPGAVTDQSDAAGAEPPEQKNSPNGGVGILGGIAESLLNLIPKALGTITQS